MNIKRKKVKIKNIKSLIKKIKYGLIFFKISSKLQKQEDFDEWLKNRYNNILKLKLDKYIKFKGKLNKKANIYFFNHQSFVEILFLVNIIKNEKMIGIVKQELQKSKFSKGFTKFDIGINRKDPRSSIKMIKKMNEYLNKDIKIILYPEGTRNKTEYPLLPFKNNLGKLLSKKELEIQGVTIKNLKEFLSGKSKYIEVEYLNTYNTKKPDWYKNIYNEMLNSLKNDK